MCLYIRALRVCAVNYTCLVADMWLIASGKSILQVARNSIYLSMLIFANMCDPTRYEGIELKVHCEWDERKAWNFDNYS